MFCDIRDTRVHVQRGGSGPPLLFLSGSAPRSVWQPHHDALAEYHTVYLPDHPGFGLSDDDDRIDSVHDMGFFYLDLIDELGISDELTVVGESFGGWVAAEIASLGPDCVTTLILIGAAGIRVEGVELVDSFLLSPAEQSAMLFHSPQLKEQAIQQAAEAGDTEELRQTVRARIAEARFGWNPLFHDPKLPDRLHRVKARTLIVWGRYDEASPLGVGEGFHRLIRGSRMEVIDASGHLPQVEQPERFLAVVAPFLAEDSTAPKAVPIVE